MLGQLGGQWHAAAPDTDQSQLPRAAGPFDDLPRHAPDAARGGLGVDEHAHVQGHLPFTLQ